MITAFLPNPATRRACEIASYSRKSIVSRARPPFARLHESVVANNNQPMSLVKSKTEP